MKIRFESDDDLPFSKILNIRLCLIIVKSVKQNFTNSFIHQLYKVSFIFVCAPFFLCFLNKISVSLLFISYIKFLLSIVFL